MQLERWQERWAKTQKVAWAKTTIPDVAKCVERSLSEPSYNVTRSLSGYGDLQREDKAEHTSPEEKNRKSQQERII